MQPTEMLMQEHRVIEQVLACLAKMADQYAGGERFDVDAARQSVDFFRVFADRCHHGKEEGLLFPLMESKGFNRQQGPTGVMLSEHQEGRQHVAAMADAIEAVAKGDADETRIFVQHAREFVALLRDHIQKEDHCLFPMANQALSAAEQQQLESSFQKVEHDDLGPGTHEKYLAIANRLAEQFNVPQAVVTAGSPCCHSQPDTLP